MNIQLFKMGARNLSRNVRRNIATGSALGLGFAGLLAILGFQNQVEHSLRAYTVYGNRTGHLVVYKHDGLDMFETRPVEFGLDARDLNAIRRITASMNSVEFEGEQLIGPGLVSNGCQSLPFYAMGIDPQLDWKVQQHPYNLKWNAGLTSLDKGRELWEYPSDSPAISLSSGLAGFLKKDNPRDLGEDTGSSDPIDCQAPDASKKLAADSVVQLASYSWNGLMTGGDAQVTGIFHTANAYYDSAAVRMPISQLRKLYGTDGAAFYSVWLKDPSKVDSALAEMKSRVKANGLNVDVYAWNDAALSPQYTGMSGFLLTLVTFIASIIAVVVVLSVSNSASMTIIERSKEIGMMRSLGFTRRWIRILFLIEVACVAAVSLVSGGVFGSGLIWVLNRAGFPLDLPMVLGGLTVKMSVSPAIVMNCAGAIFVLAIGSALFSVWRVAKTNVATLLTGSNH